MTFEGKYKIEFKKHCIESWVYPVKKSIVKEINDYRDLNNITAKFFSYKGKRYCKEFMTAARLLYRERDYSIYHVEADEILCKLFDKYEQIIEIEAEINNILTLLLKDNEITPLAATFNIELSDEIELPECNDIISDRCADMIFTVKKQVLLLSIL